jgi:hypothetical protein
MFGDLIEILNYRVASIDDHIFCFFSKSKIQPIRKKIPKVLHQIMLATINANFFINI